MNQNLTICFVRHAQSCQNASLEYRQEFHEDDPPLSPLGERQALALARRFEPGGIDRIFSSTLLRAAQTAFPIAEKLGLRIELLPELMEVKTRIAGTPAHLLCASVPLCVPCNGGKSPTGASCFLEEDSHEQRCLRAKRAIDYICRVCNENDKVLVVSHCAFFGYLLRYTLGLSLPESFCWAVDNCAVTQITLRKDDIPIVITANDTGHLFRC